MFTMFASLCVLFSLFSGWVSASPIDLQRRAISSDLLDTFNLMEQYAAAAYCVTNNDSTGDKVTCSADNCPLVEADTTNTTLEFEDTTETDTTGFVAIDETASLIVVSFRGSSSIANWIADFSYTLVDTDLCDDCTAHEGFWESWVSVRDSVTAAVEEALAEYPDYQIVAVGHSLGGAVADFCAANLRNDGYDVALYTFGSPRVAPATLSDYISNQTGGNYRVTHYNDPVPRLPTLLMGYRHISPEYYIDVPNYVNVTADDIEVYYGDAELEGNGAWVVVDVLAHLWYFNSISACSSLDISLKEKRRF